MKTLLLNVYEDKVKVLDIQPDLHEYYKALDCSCIDIVERRIGGKLFSIMCDDEGLFREDCKIAAINDMGEPMLVGNLMFFKAGADEEGNLIELDEDDIEHIYGFIQKMYTRNHPEGYRMLTQCEYY